jgi:hypothetical protein
MSGLMNVLSFGQYGAYKDTQKELKRQRTEAEQEKAEAEAKTAARNKRYAGMRQNLFSGEAGGYDTGSANFAGNQIMQ